MTTIATIAAVAAIFTWILIQEWRGLIRSQRYVCKLERARSNTRKVGVA